MAGMTSKMLLQFTKLLHRNIDAAQMALDHGEFYLEVEETEAESNAANRGWTDTRELLTNRLAEDPNKLRIGLAGLDTDPVKPKPGRIGSTAEERELRHAREAAQIASSGLSPAEWLEKQHRDREQHKEDSYYARVQSLKDSDPEVALIQHFLVGLDDRLNNFDTLMDDTQAARLPPEIHTLLNEACHCYLNGQKFATVMLCGTTIEGAIKYIAREEFRGLSDALDYAAENSLFGTQGAGGIDDHLMKLRNLAVHHPDKFARVGPEEWMQVLINTRKLLAELFADTQANL